jgi:hypothetical protein
MSERETLVELPFGGGGAQNSFEWTKEQAIPHGADATLLSQVGELGLGFNKTCRRLGFEFQQPLRINNTT